MSAAVKVDITHAGTEPNLGLRCIRVAGQAVVAHELGWEVGAMSVVPGSRMHYRINYGPPLSAFMAARSNVVAFFGERERVRVAAAIAGEVAARRHQGSQPFTISDEFAATYLTYAEVRDPLDDAVKTAWSVASMIVGRAPENAEVREVLNEGLSRSEEVLARPEGWRAVEVLAAELGRRGRLRGAAAVQVMASAHSPAEVQPER